MESDVEPRSPINGSEEFPGLKGPACMDDTGIQVVYDQHTSIFCWT